MTFIFIILLWLLSGWFGLFVIYKTANKRVKRTMRLLILAYLVAGTIMGIFVWVGIIGEEIENG